MVIFLKMKLQIKEQSIIRIVDKKYNTKITQRNIQPNIRCDTIPPRENRLNETF